MILVLTFCIIMSVVYFINLKQNDCYLVVYFINLKHNDCYLVVYFINLKQNDCYLVVYFINLKQNDCYLAKTRSKHKKVQTNAYLFWQGHTVCKFSGILLISKFCESVFNFFVLLSLSLWTCTSLRYILALTCTHTHAFFKHKMRVFVAVLARGWGREGGCSK